MSVLAPPVRGRAARGAGLRRPLLALLLACAAGDLLSAQLDIPGGERRQDAVRDARQGVDLPRRLGGRAPGPDSREDEGSELDLPASEPAAGAPTAELAPTYGADEESAARFVLDKLAGEKRFDSTLVASAVSNLASLGPAGLDAARRALRSEHGPTWLVAALVLLRAGTPEDRASLVARLDGKLPSGVAERLVEALADADPVVVDPGVLVGWLDHPFGEIRRAAGRALDGRVDATWLPYLADALASDRTDTRARALELLERIDHPGATNLLLGRLSDPAAKVARRAVQVIALDEDPSLDERLLALAFGDEGVAFGRSRGASYALLAIVEREDLQGRRILDTTHAPRLLEGLRSPDELTVGSAACALAGIGYREGVEDAGWLDLEVPHFLVRIVSAAVFHTDFASLREPAERRLELLSGRSYGNQGPLWQEWWARVAGEFVARRAVLHVEPADVDRLRLELRPEAGAETFALAGPLVRDEELEDDSTLFLRSDDMRRLDELLRREGVYGPDLVPSAEDEDLLEAQPFVDVRVVGRGKRLVPRRGEAWFARVRDLALELARRNGWQRYPDPRRHASRRAFFMEESAWWHPERTPEERSRRRRELILDHLEGSGTAAASGALAELLELEGGTRPEDFPRFLGILDRLVVPGEELGPLVELALATAPRTADGEAVDPSLVEELFDRIVLRFGGSARPAAARVLEAAPLPYLLEQTRSQEPLRRELAAGSLPADVPEARERLLALLEDPSEAVRAAAIGPLAEDLDDELAERLVQHAQHEGSRVRTAAFAALAPHPGDEITDLLIVALADRDPEVSVAACRALALRGEPESVPILAAAFARGPSSPLFAEARHALERIGPAAADELMRLTVTGRIEVQREAAVLLARLGEPTAAPVLLSILSIEPGDERLLHELAVLSCADFRSQPDPIAAWWEWWDLVVHDDSLAWFLAACELRGLAALPATAFAASADERRAVGFLLEAALLPGVVGERALRELAARYGVVPGAPPPDAAGRAAWRGDVLDGLAAGR